MNRHAASARREIEKMRRQLDAVFARAEEATVLEVRSDLARYACMQLTGFLEQALLSIGRHVVTQMSSGAALRFSESHLDRSFNPRSGPVVSFVSRFSSEWAQELEKILADDERGNSLNALVGIRNQIAHGQSQGVSIQRLYDYRKTVDTVVDFLLGKDKPAP